MTITIFMWVLPLAVYWLLLLIGAAHISFEEQHLLPGAIIALVMGIPTTLVALLTRFL